MGVSSEELLQLVESTPLEEVVNAHIFGGDPFVFRDSPESYQALLDDLSSSLAVKPEDMTIVGSAKTGFSLSPSAFGTPFHDGSDVDIVVVDTQRFDALWFTLLNWDMNVTLSAGYLKKWLIRRREDVYFGRFFTGEPIPQLKGPTRPLKYLRDIANQWFSAFQSVGLRHAALASRRFSGRLYRTWDHARTYHVAGLRKCYATNSAARQGIDEI